MSRTIGQIGEDALIRIFASRALPPDDRVIVANGDDAAVFRSAPGEGVVVTTDTLVEGVHFNLAWTSPERVGRKLIGVNVSDVAGMGAIPQYAFLSVCLSPRTEVELVERIADGIASHAKEHNVILIGGNTTGTSGPMVFTLTVVGRQIEERILRRGHSVPGDAIFTTGTLGDARGGLWVLQNIGPNAEGADAAHLIARQNDPMPRVAAGSALADTGRVSAMADISDGLGRDLRRLLSPAGVGALVFAEEVPRSSALNNVAQSHGLNALDIALSGGEDYELLLTAPPDAADELESACERVGVPLHQIGRVEDNPDFFVRDRQGQRTVLPAGFAHFD